MARFEWSYGVWLAVCVSVGLLLSIFPIPANLTWARPELLAAFCVLAALYCPFHFGIVTAWLVGLTQDVVMGEVWGAHAIASAFITYFCLSAYQRLRSYNVVQQMIWVFVMVGIHQVFVNWTYGLAGYSSPAYTILVTSFITALIWPILVVLARPAAPSWGRA